MKIYMLRHGETELNVKKVYYGSTDCALTEKGRSQAEALTPVFSSMALDAVWTSPLKRATKTASIILENNDAPRRETPLLSEVNFGEWEGKSFFELQGDPLFEQWCDQWQTTRPPKGESFCDLSERVKAFWTELQDCSAENVLIVTHHGVLQQIMATLLNGDPAACWHYAFEQGTYSLVEVTDGFAVLKGHNLRP